MELFIIAQVILFCCSLAEAETQFQNKPPAVQNVTEGEKHNMTWTYVLDQADTSDFEGIILGTFFANAFRTVYMEINPSGSVIAVLGKFTGRLKWNGDLISRKIEFLLDPVNETDAGEFTCGIYLGALKGYKLNKVTLNVWVKPQITEVSERSLVLNTGDNTAITCTATGKPTPFVSWNKRQRVGELQNIIKPSPGNSSLVLMSVDEQSASEYVCLAENPTMMNANTSFYLNVKYLMAEAKEIDVTKVTAVPGQKEKICCPIMGYPPPFFTWTLPNGTVISSFDKCIVVSSTGNYSCEASNEVGTEEVNVVYGSKEGTHNATWDSKDLNWTHRNDVVSYTIDIREVGNQNLWYLSAGVRPSTTICSSGLDKPYPGGSLNLIVRISALLKNGQTVMWVYQRFRKTFEDCGVKA